MAKGRVIPDGKKVVQFRAHEGWSQEDLAARAGVVKKTVGNVEKNKPVYPTTLHKIAGAFGKEVKEIVQHDELLAAITIDRFDEPIVELLPPRPAIMVGRASDVTELISRLSGHDDSRSATAVVRGWPGVGKSTLAASLVNDIHLTQEYPDGVLWCSLGQRPNVFSWLVQWGRALGIEDAFEAETPESASLHLTGYLRNKRVLLVVDDVWQSHHARPFSVGGDYCATLITTRLQDVAVALAQTPSDVYRLDVLSEDAGLTLLAYHAPQVVDIHRTKCLELVRCVECLPLALHVAGRLLAAESLRGWGVDELLAGLVGSQSTILDAPAPSDMSNILAQTPQTVATLFKKSLSRLDPVTQQRFAQLGVFASDPATFDLDAMEATWEVKDPKPTARLLADRGLLEPIGGSRFRMHALLAAFARTILEG